LLLLKHAPVLIKAKLLLLHCKLMGVCNEEVQGRDHAKTGDMDNLHKNFIN